MTTTSNLEVTLEAEGATPNFRHDMLQPLLQGRVAIEGVTLKPADPEQRAGIFEDPKFKNGDFGLLAVHIGDVPPAIDAGWDVINLPVVVKHKPLYSHLWVRVDRGIDSPKDLEGKTFSALWWSIVATYMKGVLKRFHDVDITTLRWVPTTPLERWPLYKPVLVDAPPEGPRKGHWERLLDGEVDACVGDVTNAKVWAALESSPTKVKRLFSDHHELNGALIKEHGMFMPAHIILMGGKLHRNNPGLARKLFDAFERSREIAYDDALADGTTYSMVMLSREHLRDQLDEFGDVHKHGVKANANSINALLDFAYDQGQTKKRLTLEEFFADGTMDT